MARVVLGRALLVVGTIDTIVFLGLAALVGFVDGDWSAAGEIALPAIVGILAALAGLRIVRHRAPWV